MPEETTQDPHAKIREISSGPKPRAKHTTSRTPPQLRKRQRIQGSPQDLNERGRTIIRGLPLEIQDEVWMIVIFSNLSLIQLIQLIGTNDSLDSIIAYGLSFCRFDIDWSKGIRVLFPGSKLLNKAIPLVEVYPWVDDESPMASYLMNFMIQNKVVAKSIIVPELTTSLDMKRVKNPLLIKFLKRCFFQTRMVTTHLDSRLLDSCLSCATSLEITSNCVITESLLSGMSNMNEFSTTSNSIKDPLQMKLLEKWCKTPTNDRSPKKLLICIINDDDSLQQILDFTASICYYNVDICLKLCGNRPIPHQFFGHVSKISYTFQTEDDAKHYNWMDDFKNLKELEIMCSSHTSDVPLKNLYIQNLTLYGIPKNVEIYIEDTPQLRRLELMFFDIKPVLWHSIPNSVEILITRECNFLMMDSFRLPHNIFYFKFGIHSSACTLPYISNTHELFYLSDVEVSCDDSTTEAAQRFVDSLPINLIKLNFIWREVPVSKNPLCLRKLTGLKVLKLDGDWQYQFDFSTLPSTLEYLDFDIGTFHLINPLPTSLKFLKIGLQDYCDSFTNFWTNHIADSGLIDLNITSLRAPAELNFINLGLGNLLNCEISLTVKKGALETNDGLYPPTHTYIRFPDMSDVSCNFILNNDLGCDSGRHYCTIIGRNLNSYPEKIGLYDGDYSDRGAYNRVIDDC